MKDAAAMSKFVCEQNIQRYESMLRTPLTDLERDFIQQRIGEERQVLRALTTAGKRMSKIVCTAFIPDLIEYLMSGFDLAAQVNLI